MTHSKIYNLKNKAQLELSRLKSNKGSTMGYIVGFELREVATSLGILIIHVKDSGDVFKLITNSTRFLEMTEAEIVAMPISGPTERRLLEAHKKHKEVHYSFMKEIEEL